MNVGQPSKIGKVSYLLALMSVFLSLTPILHLFRLKLTLWDVPFLISGVLLIIAACILANKDLYMSRLGWGFLMWRPSTTRDRLATLLMLVGGLWIVVILSAPGSPVALDSSGNSWLVTIAAGIALLLGWVLILTEREEPTSVRKPDSTST